EALTPELPARDHRREIALSLRSRAVLTDRRADQVDVRLRRRAGGPHFVEGLVEKPALDHRRAAATVLARAGDHGPAAVQEPLLPLAGDAFPERVLDPRPAVVAAPLARAGGLEPGFGLGGESELGGGEREVHERPSGVADRTLD